MGNMGMGHLRYIKDGLCPKLEVSAFADTDPQKLEQAKRMQPDASAFADAGKMLDSGLVDAALIAVPHYQHPKHAMECFRRGIHVMIEKPPAYIPVR